MKKSKEIAKRIREIRESKGLTQEDLADLMNIERSYITKLENGQINMSIDYLQKVCEALKCNLHIILEP